MPDPIESSVPSAVRLAGEVPARGPVGRPFAGRLVAVAVALVALWVAAAVSSRAAHEQRAHRGERAAAHAADALRGGRAAEAVRALRDAVALEPGRAEYRLELAKALVATGKPAEAEPYVHEALRQQPVDGEANLVLARILRQTGSVEDAERAYYRAIYGRWERDALPQRMAARLELVALYRDAGQRHRLRAALLELSTAFPGDRVLQLQAGRELLANGFAADAAQQLRAVVERFAEPGEALGLLARAEFASGNYIEAYAAAGRALRSDPRDEASARLRSLTARVLTLDPDQPRLSVRERTRRVRVLLTEARDRLRGCAGAEGSSSTPSVRPLMTAWLGDRTPDADVGRALLAAVASSLAQRCPPVAEDDALGLVLDGLAEGGVP